MEIVAFDDVHLLDLAAASQVFAVANELAARAGRALPYLVSVTAPDGQRVQSTSGIEVGTSPLSPPDEPLHTLIVVGGQGVMNAARNLALIAWLERRARTAGRVASVCTGAFLLAAAGLLDDRRAVTHWEFCDRLAKSYPRIKVEVDPIFVRDGTVWTSAGVTAGIDLCLALVEEDLGRPIALGVARNLVVFLKRPGGQAQFSAALSLQTSDERLANLNAWITEHLSEDLPLRRLAEQARMSERTFQRRYRDATGLTPLRAVERLRVEAARQLLLDTRMPIKRIATRCGFGSEETMRRSFLRVQGVGPHDFRSRFGSGGATTGEIPSVG